MPKSARGIKKRDQEDIEPITSSKDLSEIKSKYTLPKNKIAGSNSSNKILYGVLISIVLITSMLAMGIFSPEPDIDVEDLDQKWNDAKSDTTDMTLFSSPSCGCCHLYADYLESFGFTTKIEYPEKLSDLKSYLQIPGDVQSCHTIQFQGYFIEGHIPIEAINKLISEKPDIDGIALPGMPAGSPGMESAGEKNQDFLIQSIKDGKISSLFMTI